LMLSRGYRQPRGLFGKSWFDRFAALILLVGFAPVIAIVWLLVKCTSEGPGIFAQRRVGLGGKVFRMYKFRSMCENAEADGKAKWCGEKDPRVTPLGRWLRKLHLDELPQLWNVARGDMSFVGPRPERPEIIAYLEKEIEKYHDRLLVRPGITGIAQINLPPDQTIDSVRRKQSLDILYIREMSWHFDIRIMLATAMRLFGLSGVTVTYLMGLHREPQVDGASPTIGVDERDELSTTPFSSTSGGTKSGERSGILRVSSGGDASSHDDSHDSSTAVLDREPSAHEDQEVDRRRRRPLH
jgi:lipopolysaccharide/colanic/teichoic acid biosynthesis glycosyltransferase